MKSSSIKLSLIFPLLLSGCASMQSNNNDDADNKRYLALTQEIVTLSNGKQRAISSIFNPVSTKDECFINAINRHKETGETIALYCLDTKDIQTDLDKLSVFANQKEVDKILIESLEKQTKTENLYFCSENSCTSPITPVPLNR